MECASGENSSKGEVGGFKRAYGQIKMIIGVRPGRILHIFFPLVLWLCGSAA